MVSLRLFPSMSIVLVACGGTVVFGEGEGGAGDGGSSSVGTNATSTNAATTNAASTANASSANAGGGTSSGNVSSANAGGSSPTSVSVTTGTGGQDCDGRNYAECLGASDRCVPAFDDYCCSDCFPGGCSDCIDFVFVACVPREEQGPKGSCGSPPCGFIPYWACEGTSPNCADGCFGEPGCVEKLYCEGDGCGVECAGVRPDACGPVDCDGIPPECFDGTVPEAAGGCWTGACIPYWVCAIPQPL